LANEIQPYFTKMYKEFHHDFGERKAGSSLGSANEHGMFEEIKSQ
jgi:5-methylthioadenosine/S-adenosylhomocysteine deaminase